MRRILLTGGAGFLGSHLCDRLVERGCEVLCADNLLTGRLENIAHLLDHPRFRFVHCDVSDALQIEGPLDAVLHFASPASPRDYLELPIHTLKVGAYGTHNALELARATGARFLLASTSEVYGDPLVNPQPETYWGNVNPVSPRGVYDEAKRFGEAMTMAYHRYHGLDTRIVRIFNTYGPRMRTTDGRVISNFIVQALRGEPLTVHGDGTQTRSFCYLDDMIQGILAVLDLPSDRTPQQRVDREFLQRSRESEDSIHEPVNLGNPEERSVLEIAHLVLAATGSRSPLRFVPRPVDDPRVRRPDTSRAQRLVGWRPTVTLEEGIRRTVAYFESQIGQQDIRRAPCPGR
ncbi:MAG: SDR family oxidoreductase [Armatimonadota bacterium]|nr:SDR family oxidoreductase [Armatimonadota bacterium]MDR7519567.1 SDR family oxidoreductase [Armatimonadota bacterium]MDR7550138.1 SDR family oxidoreductase [Armatimonadota bacterium]